MLALVGLLALVSVDTAPAAGPFSAVEQMRLVNALCRFVEMAQA